MTDDGSGEFSASSFASETDPVVAVAEQPEPRFVYKEKPVVVTGASGHVGSRTCAYLVERGFKVRALVRNTAKAAEKLGHLRIEIREGDIRDSDTMRAALSGAGSIVHLAAIAIEKRGESYESTNTEATNILLDAARAERVNRIVYMSQNGADSSSPYRFLRSKGLAQDIVTSSSMRWSVLKPSVIFGPDDEFVNVLARLVRLSPVVYPLPGGGSARFQPVSVGDVAQAIVKCLEDDRTVGRLYLVGGPVPLTLRQMTERILVAMNASRVLVGVPVALLRPLIALAQRLLPHPPVTTGLLDLLKIDNVVSPNELETELGIDPVPFAPEELLYLREISFRSALKSMIR
ncbi:MAG TPA: complex I NDUFA9 subunit family protein [Gemmatimonadaceae bacterium]